MADKIWVGSEPVCDFCGTPPTQFFVDGKTTLGPWAIMCLGHHRQNGVGLGTGRGQKYEHRPDKAWHKVEG